LNIFTDYSTKIVFFRGTTNRVKKIEEKITIFAE